MEHFFYEGKVMWSQIDSNNHLRHSAYADFGAQARLQILEKMGFNSSVLETLKIGPILFREELIYMREIKINETVKITCELTKCRIDGSRWSFKQIVFKEDGTEAAIINVDGAWIDITKRKLTGLPKDLADAFISIPKSTDFILEEIPVK